MKNGWYKQLCFSNLSLLIAKILEKKTSTIYVGKVLLLLQVNNSANRQIKHLFIQMKIVFPRDRVYCISTKQQ